MKKIIDKLCIGLHRFFGIVQKDAASSVKLGKNTKVRNSFIDLKNNSELIIEDNVTIQGFTIRLVRGRLKIGHDSILKDGTFWNPNIVIKDARAGIADHCVVSASLVVKWGAVLEVGAYTFIGERTEVHCDQKIVIGMFNMISADSRIFDNNSHSIISKDERRERTKKFYPLIGHELEKPVAADVVIGDDVWIGQNVIILKGSEIGNCCVVGAGAVVAGLKAPENALVAGNPAGIVKSVR